MKIKYFYLVFLFVIISCKTNTIKKPPLAISKPISENYFGKTILDSYRNLEDLKDSTVQKWFKTQSEYSNEIISKINGRNSLIKKMKELDNRYSFGIKNTRLTQNKEYFYLKKTIKEKRFKLYYRKEFTSQEELLFDPSTFKINSKNKYTINYIQPSWNGKYIIVAMSYKGKELSEMIIINMEKREILPQIITNAWPSSFLGVNWLPDNSGFTYLHFPITDSSNKNFKKNTQSVFYKIGQDPKKLNVIFSSKTHPNLGITSGDYPSTKIKSPSDKYITGYLAGVNNYWNGFYLKISDLKEGNLNWKPLITANDKSFRSSGFFNGDLFIYKSAKKTSNFKITSIDFSSNKKARKILVPEFKNETIRDFSMTHNGLFFTTLKNGVDTKLYYLKDKLPQNIKLPKQSGNIGLQSVGNDLSEIWIYINGWINGEIRYQYNLANNRFIQQDIIAKSNYPEFDNLIVEEIEVTSHDGIKVPLSIVYDKNIKRNGKNPVIIDGYGAYGSSMSPYFSPIILSWVLEGGVFCTSHVRGGGEKGDNWHKSGLKTTKSNTWKDLIACSEYLIKKKYTSKKKLTIFSSSAGGIMVGRAMTERPDLFSAAIVQVGMMNPIRNEAMPGEGGANYKEYGSVKDSMECLSLIEMDPYLHINKNIQYPATFLTCAMNDTRVAPWIPGKFIAKLQASDSKRPVVFNVKYDEGHNTKSIYDEWATIYSFALWQSGHPDYKLN